MKNPEVLPKEGIITDMINYMEDFFKDKFVIASTQLALANSSVDWGILKDGQVGFALIDENNTSVTYSNMEIHRQPTIYFCIPSNHAVDAFNWTYIHELGGQSGYILRDYLFSLINPFLQYWVGDDGSYEITMPLPMFDCNEIGLLASGIEGVFHDCSKDQVKYIDNINPYIT